jgi:hypothetical protein
MQKKSVIALCAVSILVSLLTFESLAQKPSDGPWPPKRLERLSHPWVVYMVPQPSLDKGVPVAEAGTKEDAEAIAKAMQDREYKEGRFPHPTFIVRGPDDSSEGTEDSAGIRNLVLPLPGGKQLVVPLSNVDLKPLPTATPPVIDLTGKKAK